MLLCATLWMLWLEKFEHPNCCWGTGSYGWFMPDKETPLNGWYSFNKDSEIVVGYRLGDGVYYTRGTTSWFDINKKKKDMNTDGKIVSSGTCKLDGKKYYYIERVTKE